MEKPEPGGESRHIEDLVQGLSSDKLALTPYSPLCWPTDEADLGTLFSIELNERVYTLKVRLTLLITRLHLAGARPR